MRLLRFSSPLLLLLCAGCAMLSPATTTAPVQPEFKAATFADLPGWTNDDLTDARIAFTRTCGKFATMSGDKALKYAGTVTDWRAFCAAVTVPDGDIRTAITDNLKPWRVIARGADDGLFTGYYEASLHGSRTRNGPYQTPIRGRPLDHVIVDLGDFKPELKGQRVTGQLVGDAGSYTLKPYPARAGIMTGKIPPVSDQILAWVDSPTDAFFLEIQGSGQISLDDGTTMHVGYAERNGQAYTAVGKILVERGVMTKEQASMQSIRAWLAANPDQAQDLMNQNASYIFFREIGPDGPLGAQGVALTPMRSLAVDSTIWSYGVPFFLDAASPDGNPDAPRLQRLMVAQDTGGAIRGAIRGDVFWGYGPQAEANAGTMKSRGNYWLLLPKGVTPQ